MNKFGKVCVTIFTVGLILGGIVFGIGVFLGGSEYANAHGRTFLKKIGLGNFSNYLTYNNIGDEWFDSDSTYYKSNESYNVTYDKLDKLTVNANAANVNISLNPAIDTVVITANYGKNCKYAIDDKKKNEIEINFKRKKNINGEDEINIEIPSDYEIGTLSFNMGAGDIDVENLKVNSLICSTGAGDVDMTGLDAQNINMDCATGDIDLDLIGAKDDYNFAIDCAMGDISVQGEKTSGIGTSYNKSSYKATRDLTIDCAMGDVDITF